MGCTGGTGGAAAQGEANDAIGHERRVLQRVLQHFPAVLRRQLAVLRPATARLVRLLPWCGLLDTVLRTCSSRSCLRAP